MYMATKFSETFDDIVYFIKYFIMIGHSSQSVIVCGADEIRKHT